MNKQIIIINIFIVLLSEYYYIPLILKRYLFIRIKGTLISLFKSELKIFPYSQMRTRGIRIRDKKVFIRNTQKLFFLFWKVMHHYFL